MKINFEYDIIRGLIGWEFKPRIENPIVPKLGRTIGIHPNYKQTYIRKPQVNLKLPLSQIKPKFDEI